MIPQISVFSVTYTLATTPIIEAKKAKTATKGALNRAKFSINNINEPENKLSNVPKIPNISSKVLEVLIKRLIFIDIIFILNINLQIKYNFKFKIILKK